MKIDFSTTKKVSIKNLVYEKIKKSIIKSELEPGQMLSEQELATKLGVSRTPVRETLIQLNQEGLVDIYPQRGTLVSFINKEEVIQAQFIRESLEVATAKKLIEIVTEDQVYELQKNINKQKLTYINQEYEEFYEFDEQFHEMLAAFSGYPKIWEVIKKEKIQLDRIRLLGLPNNSIIQGLIEQHQTILNSLAKKDKESLIQMVIFHTREVLNTLEQICAQNPKYFN